ncbi:MAG TPA: DUF4215 domain-containing protein [Candidatus Polarisedimenticolaceae bacterium]|nr:DUF4215 domain-containing protein [Candidatus Polarisedimenticolaceae bacterium]
MADALRRSGVLLALLVLPRAIQAETGCPDTVCAGLDSGCPTDSFSTVLDQICSLDPSGNCSGGRCGCCREETDEPFAGVTFGPPGGSPPVWPGIGGRGRLAAESELCLLRDLGELPGGEFAVEPPAISLGPFGKATVRQRVGFVSFDPLAGRMQGYHGVSLCVPPFGCVGDRVQSFTATLRTSASPPGLHCGDYPFADAYGLEVATSDTERRLDLELTAVTVLTPYGTVEATPEFHYGTAMKSGYPTDPSFDRILGCNVATYWGSDLYAFQGRSDGASGLDFLCTLLPRPALQPGFGTVGQIAFGSRAANPSRPAYVPGTPRPDLDLFTARTEAERIPVGAVGAAAEFKYDAAGLVPERYRTSPFHLVAEVFVRPGIDSRFASQFQVHGSDAFYQRTLDVGDCTPGNPMLAGVSLRSRAESFVSFGVDAGFNLVLTVRMSVGFGTITATILEKHPKFDVLPPITEETGADGPVAQAVFDASAIPGFTTLDPLSSGPVDGDAFLQECFQAPPPEEKKPPTPAFTPDDPTKFTSILEFPCNVCLGWGSLALACGPRKGFDDDYPCSFTDGVCTDPAGQDGCTTYPVPPELLPPGAAGSTTVLFPTTAGEGLEPWLCDAASKNGCMDLCTYDPRAAQPLQVVRSAAELDPDRCSVPGTGNQVCTSAAQCDDANPCTFDTCAGGELGYCVRTPQEAPCDDGLFCNGADRCALGTCAIHDGNPCAGSAQDCCSEKDDVCLDATACPAPGPRCGNAFVQPGEECDDGNTVAGDGCSEACRTECGNGTVDPGETCDDGNEEDGDGCSASCQDETTPLDCGDAFATTSELWPPNHQWVDVAVSGVTDAAGTPASITITGIRQDEPVDGLGDGDTCPDGEGMGTSTARLRAERAGTAKVPGDGRVYHVEFTASDGQGGSCTGTVLVCVPHDRRPGQVCVDGGTPFDSGGGCP